MGVASLLEVHGGLCTIGSVRYAKANNAYLQELYDPDDETSFILATYANNLYGKAMTEPLPYGNLDWFNPFTYNNGCC